MKIITDYSAVCYSKGRPSSIKGIVYHSMDGTYAGSISWFRNKASQASAHYLISAKGEIRKMVRDKDMAWHAGVFKPGRPPKWMLPNPNFSTIGIELEDKRQRSNYKYPQKQINAVIDLTRYLCKKWNIKTDGSKFFNHKYLDPGRRSDPVGNWKLSWVVHGLKTKPEWKKNLENISDRTRVMEKKVQLIDFSSKKVLKTYKKGTKLTIHFETKVGDTSYYMTKYSVNNNLDQGIIRKEFNYKAPLPPPLTPKPTPPPVIDPEPEPPIELPPEASEESPNPLEPHDPPDVSEKGKLSIVDLLIIFIRTILRR